MAKYLGGDISGITVNHPTLGSFNFQAKANESFTFDPGGHRNQDDANNVSANGTPVYIKNKVLASVEGVILSDFTSNQEFNSIEKMQSSSEDATWTFTMLSGLIYKITGQPVGDIKFDTMTANLPIKIVGNKLQKI